MDKTQQKKYEITFHITAEDISGVKREIEKVNGAVIEERPFVKMELAYPIDKQKFIFCGIIVFTMNPELIKDFDKNLKLSKTTSRHLINVVSEKKEGDGRRKADRRPEGDGPIPSIKIKSFDQTLTNEALEKKIEEILQ